MNVVWRALGVVGASVPGFPFALGEACGTATSASVTWSLRKGTRNEDKAPVTIFTYANDPKDVAGWELARNVLRHAKVLKLPGVLRCYEAVEYRDTIYIATEPCIPLVDMLTEPLRTEYCENEEVFHMSVAWGLHTVSRTLQNFHRNNLIHANVNVSSVFVLRSGEWRLFGLELVSPFADDSSIFRRNNMVLAEHRRPPEVSSSSSVAQVIHAVDAWGIGCLIYEVFSTPSDSVKISEMKSYRGSPRSLQSGFVGMLSSNPKMRLPLDRFLSDTEYFTSSGYVSTMMDLEELSIKDAVDKDKSYRKLATVVGDFPLIACKLIILPILNTAVQFGGGSAAALEPLLRIGSRFSPEDFAQHLAPLVVSLFASQEHLVRYQLLSTIQQYASLLPPTLVCEKIWPHYATGFTNRNADIRELTVRALVHVAPLLTEKLLTGEAVRNLSQLQQDAEGPIRTNATICLGMIAKTLPAAAKSKILAGSFCRMLKDPFLPSRLAAIRSIASTANHFTAQHIAEAVMPQVAMCAIDPKAEVREATLATLQILLSKLQENHESTPPDVIEAAGDSGAVSTNPEPAATGTPSAPERKTSGLWGWWGKQPEMTVDAKQVAAPGSAPAEAETTTAATANANVSDAPQHSSRVKAREIELPDDPSEEWSNEPPEPPRGGKQDGRDASCPRETAVPPPSAVPTQPTSVPSTTAEPEPIQRPSASSGAMKLKKRGFASKTSID